MKMYDGSTCPEEHITQYKERMEIVLIPKYLKEVCLYKGLQFLNKITKKKNPFLDFQITYTFLHQKCLLFQNVLLALFHLLQLIRTYPHLLRLIHKKGIQRFLQELSQYPLQFITREVLIKK